ncbi:hypothetical protein [Rhizobium sp. Leaf262]|uniref:hypothetical protein n=1 Tax=Rhizobium sp. Leaf262 TaxID=1736312 RepID=UPI000713AEFD|nr:hypothetical protein [Rhizobium sp. Leaf262]KQO75278.1 hypothetical protein ASF29_12750 [Rhizobium sp. Leaf262]
MKRKDRVKKITILQAALNPYYAEAFGLIFKLSYAPEGKNTPRLEVFADGDLAREKDWRIYGAIPDHDLDNVVEIKFRAPGESKEFSVASRLFRVQFTRVDRQEFTYAHGSNEALLLFEFEVSSLD